MAEPELSHRRAWLWSPFFSLHPALLLLQGRLRSASQTWTTWSTCIQLFVLKAPLKRQERNKTLVKQEGHEDGSSNNEGRKG